MQPQPYFTEDISKELNNVGQYRKQFIICDKPSTLDNKVHLRLIFKQSILTILSGIQRIINRLPDSYINICECYYRFHTVNGS